MAFYLVLKDDSPKGEEGKRTLEEQHGWKLGGCLVGCWDGPGKCAGGKALGFCCVPAKCPVMPNCAIP